jgi:hypothetical protein
MQTAVYYIEQAEKATRIASLVTDESVAAELRKMAEDYRDIAEDLGNGAIEIRHAERMPQLKHTRP